MGECFLPGDDRPLTPEVAQGVLASLRWGPDQQIINPFGEHVWLKQMPSPGPQLPMGYITDCCFVADPCERHRAMET